MGLNFLVESGLGPGLTQVPAYFGTQVPGIGLGLISNPGTRVRDRDRVRNLGLGPTLGSRPAERTFGINLSSYA